MITRVRIKVDEEGYGELFINDTQVHNVVMMDIRVVAGQQTRISFDLLPAAIEFDGETKELLLSAGLVSVRGK